MDLRTYIETVEGHHFGSDQSEIRIRIFEVLPNDCGVRGINVKRRNKTGTYRVTIRVNYKRDNRDDLINISKTIKKALEGMNPRNFRASRTLIGFTVDPPSTSR